MSNYKLIFIIIIILIIFYSINKLIKKYKNDKKEIKEHYLTYFLPYYNTNIKEIAKFYDNNDNKKNFFKKKFFYKPLIFIYNDYQKYYITQLSKIIISKSFLYKTINLKLNDVIKSVQEVNSGNINFIVSDLPTLVALKHDIKIDTNNIRYVSKLYKKKVYFFTNKTSGIESLKNISKRFVVGIPGKKNEINIFLDTIINDMGYVLNKDYTIIYAEKDDLKDLFELLNDKKVDIVIFTETFPSKNVNNILKNNTNKDILLLPFECNNETLFFKENFYFEKNMVDLNDLSENYLPKKFNNNEYTIYKPSMYMLSYNTYLFSNIFTDKKYIYDIVKTIFENIDYLNIFFKDNKIESLMFRDYEFSIFYAHYGLRQYLFDKGYISLIDSPSCKYFIGNKACTQENIDNNPIYNE
jgi:TRAP-type uncharacterized transport system substrate-binding protein